jgi:hypothetical protein
VAAPAITSRTACPSPLVDGGDLFVDHNNNKSNKKKRNLGLLFPLDYITKASFKRSIPELTQEYKKGKNGSFA